MFLLKFKFKNCIILNHTVNLLKLKYLFQEIA